MFKLAKRDFELACLISKGLSNSEVAFEFGNTDRGTVIAISRLYKKLEITTGNQRVKLANMMKEGLISEQRTDE